MELFQVERSSRYGSTGAASSGAASKSSSPAPTYRSTLSNVRERAAQVEAPAPVRARSYGVDSSRKSPEPKPEAKSATSTYKRYGSAVYSPTTETPTLRFGSSSRFGGQIARSPISEKSPTIFGVSKPTKDEEKKRDVTVTTETITLVSRGTSPTPPSNSTFLRARRAEMDRTLEKTIPKLKPRHTTYSVECQTDEKCIEDAKLESKLSAASALTARTPTSSSSYSRFSIGSTKYTPRTSAYHGTRPTELSLKTSSLGKTSTQDEIKTEPSPTTEEKSKRLEGKDTQRIGGFSYARPTDLPLALNKAMADTDGNDTLVSPSKLRSTSPQTPSLSARPTRREQINSSVGYKSPSEQNEDNLTHSIKKEKSITSISSLTAKITSPKITSPDRCKLPPPSPKLEILKNIPNKDFRKSELNKSFSSSNESLNAQKPTTPTTKSEQNSLERSPSTKSPVKLSISKSMVKLPSTSPSPRLVQSPSKALPIPSADKDENSESSSEDVSSTESSSSSESESSDSDNDEPAPVKPSALNSAISGSKLSIASSKYSTQMSSADEASVSVDKPPRPPSGLKTNKLNEDKRTEEAKAVVVRALAPVAGVMKVKYPSSTEETSDKDVKPSETDKLACSPAGHLEKSSSKSSIGSEKKGFRIQHIQSGERAWWMGPPENDKKASDKSDTEHSLVSKTEPDAKQSSPGGRTSVTPTVKTDGTKSNSASETEMKPPIPLRQCKVKKPESSSGSDGPGLERSPSVKSLRKDKSSNSLYRIKRIESGEQAWWLQESDDNTSSGVQDMPLDVTCNKESEPALEGRTNSSPGLNPSPVSKPDLGDRLGGSSDDSVNGYSRQTESTNLINANHKMSSIPKKAHEISRIESGERAWWMGDSDSSNKEPHRLQQKSPSPKIPQRIVRIESGDRSSWFGEEEHSNRGVPNLDKVPPNNECSVSKTEIESGEQDWRLGVSEEFEKEPPPPSLPKSSTPPRRSKDLPLFIGRHTNIDDVLGTQAPPPAAFRTPQNSSDGEFNLNILEYV